MGINNQNTTMITGISVNGMVPVGQEYDGIVGDEVCIWNPPLSDFYKQLPSGRGGWGKNPYMPDFTTTTTNLDKEEEIMCRKLVQVYVVDPDVRVPDEKAVLYESKEFVTIETEDEIRDGLDLKGMLKKHNEVRVKILDEVRTDESDRDIFLRKIRIKDISIQILDILTFE